MLLVLLAGCAGATDRTAAGKAHDRLAQALAQGDSDRWDALPATWLAATADLEASLEHIEMLHGESAETPQSEFERQDELTRDILDSYYGDLRAHEMRHRLLLAQGDREQAAFHRNAHRKLVAAISATGDGSAQAPYQVLTSAQAQAWLSSQRCTRAGAIYKADPDTDALYLVFQSRQRNDDALETIWFELTPTLRALAAQRAAPVLTPRQFIRERADAGDLSARTSQAIHVWESGDGDRIMQAVQWLQEASDAGHVVAQETLGVIYAAFAQGREPQQGERLVEAAIDQLLLAIQQGSTSALYNLGQLYVGGHFGEENQPGGIRLLEQASDRGDLDARVLLARLYYNGQFVHRDQERALKLLQQAAADGHREARLSYVRHHLSQDDPGPLSEQALDWLQELAEQDEWTDAMLLLGSLLARGDVVSRDPAAAVGWFKRAAASTGDADVINTVAWILVVAEQRDLRDPDHGLELMTRLMEQDEIAARNAAYMDTWAAAHAATGDFERAVTLQEEAVAIAEAEKADRGDEGPEYLPLLRDHLDKFRRGDTVSEDVP